jgi:dihydrofolate synthase/folylpolyglutamate synthase
LSPFAVAVISILEDKDARGFLEAINDSIVSVVITKSSSPRAMPVEELAALAVQIFGEDRVETEERYEDALAVAKTLLPGTPNAAIIVTGSITLVGDALKVQQKADDLDA